MLNNSTIAYCTNVHAGSDLASVIQNLKQYTLAVRKALTLSNDWRGDEWLGVGLWLAESAATEVLQGDNLDRLKDWLAENLLLPFTFNGFPQGNFHQTIVKHRVYQPTWWQTERLDYTRSLIRILDGLLPSGQVGSISTLPIAWSFPRPTSTQWQQAARNLKQVAMELHQLRQATDRLIVLAIEPEPGCAITDGASLRAFFREYLLDDHESEIFKRHLTVCHDICHAAVMREIQAQEIEAYREMGLRIGKVQVSSALEVDWSAMEPGKRMEAFAHLGRFAEDRYLHQTTVVAHLGSSPVLHEDLPTLMQSVGDPESLQGSWRVHFHVPIFHKNAGLLGTTQSDIRVCLAALDEPTTVKGAMPSTEAFFTGHLEVETYAWTVLPNEHRGSSLADDIADELRYLRAMCEGSC